MVFWHDGNLLTSTPSLKPRLRTPIDKHGEAKGKIYQLKWIVHPRHPPHPGEGNTRSSCNSATCPSPMPPYDDYLPPAPEDPTRLWAAHASYSGNWDWAYAGFTTCDQATSATPSSNSPLHLAPPLLGAHFPMTLCKGLYWGSLSWTSSSRSSTDHPTQRACQWKSAPRRSVKGGEAVTSLSARHGMVVKSTPRAGYAKQRTWDGLELHPWRPQGQSRAAGSAAERHYHQLVLRGCRRQHRLCAYRQYGTQARPRPAPACRAREMDWDGLLSFDTNPKIYNPPAIANGTTADQGLSQPGHIWLSWGAHH